jgi:hypothetical protein
MRVDGTLREWCMDGVCQDRPPILLLFINNERWEVGIDEAPGPGTATPLAAPASARTERNSKEPHHASSPYRLLRPW